MNVICMQVKAERMKVGLSTDLNARQTDGMHVGKIYCTAVTSKRFDSSALKTAQPELYATFTRGTTTRRFTVT